MATYLNGLNAKIWDLVDRADGHFQDFVDELVSEPLEKK